MVAIPGKIRALRVRPSQSADLSFNMSGIIASRNYDPASKKGSAYLGRKVAGFDIDAEIYRKLGQTLPAGGGIEANARLKYDASAIKSSFTRPPTAALPAPYLFSLRNESIGSSLDQAVNRRENSYLEKFKYAAQIQGRLTTSQPAIVAHLEALVTKSKARFDELDHAYAADGVTIRKKVQSEQGVSADYKMKMKTSTAAATLATWNAAMDGAGNVVGQVLTTEVKDPAGTVLQKHEMVDAASIPRLRQADGTWQIPSGATFPSQTTDSETTSDGKQISIMDNAQYAHLPLDNAISYHQLAVASHTELIRQDLSTFRVAHTARMLENELRAIDLDVRGLQTNYAHTFLTSPFEGIVTAVYKEVGESVEPGEPVVRIENDTVVLVVGQINLRGPVRVGMPASVTASNLFESGRATNFPGTIVAVRGHDVDDDEWDVIIEVDNPMDTAGVRLLPLNYGFDSDTTTISVG